MPVGEWLAGAVFEVCVELHFPLCEDESCGFACRMASEMRRDEALH
jgi:hypothetical protein